MATPTVFVCGATGAQGGRLARRLRAMGWGVHTTVRTPGSPAAQALSSIGVKITPGDWWRILSIAKAAGVTQIVYSSGLAHEGSDPESIPSRARASKRTIEQATRDAGFAAWTVLRPAYFMTNLVRPNVDVLYPGASATGVFTLAIGPDTTLPLIDPDDIARFAAAAFQHPDRFHGETIDLAAEEVSMADILALLSRAAGRELRGNYLSDAEIEAQKRVNPFLIGQLDLRDGVRQLDLEKTKSWGVPLGSLAEFLEREKQAVEETYRDVPV
ncbi:c30aefd4-b8d6-4107-b876-14d3599a4e04 [Thermothielavioides terrestris]|uniref:C30aefd4-b8d6-4107-b876-14d3599a4e04 n=1 Tax=Thermothielavioides terrestris TaxID=2587410 RepID=A0A446BCN7_9PEZI|nr:c30aefd4-b8d6-4107-b876-14d3599a4e04 [Thermothielavioides terrestris]